MNEPGQRPTPAAHRLLEVAARLGEIDRALWEALVCASTRPVGRPRYGSSSVVARRQELLEAYATFSGLTTDEVRTALDADLEYRFGPLPPGRTGWWGCPR
jgi:hypothetical protein